jgi:ubiquinone/menaquinone biosynthesis C-methylase UbiE
MSMKNYKKETIDFYNKNIDEYIKKTQGLQDSAWLKKFVKLLPKKAKILDLGCGYGRDTQTFVDLGFDCYGVDLSEKMIERAKSRVKKAKFFVMDILDLDFADKFFDGIWCNATIVHISKKDIDQAFNQIYKILKHNGFFHFNLKEGTGEKFEADERYKGIKKFYSYYSENEIKDLLKKHGFEIIESWHKEPKGYDNAHMFYFIVKKI